jgi:translocon-associated protein subunit alpha
MKFNLLPFLSLLVVLYCGVAQETEEPAAAAAAEDRQFKHPLTDMPGPSEDISTSVYFPNHPDHKLPIGEVVTTLCHFTNSGGSAYNVSAIMGSLNAPFDFHHHFQNYSYKPVGMTVNSGEEISLQYSFQLHPDLEPVDYQLAVTVFYESETESFSTTFFNQVNVHFMSRICTICELVFVFLSY